MSYESSTGLLLPQKIGKASLQKHSLLIVIAHSLSTSPIKFIFPLVLTWSSTLVALRFSSGLPLDAVHGCIRVLGVCVRHVIVCKAQVDIEPTTDSSSLSIVTVSRCRSFSMQFTWLVIVAGQPSCLLAPALAVRSLVLACIKHSEFPTTRLPSLIKKLLVVDSTSLLFEVAPKLSIL